MRNLGMVCNRTRGGSYVEYRDGYIVAGNEFSGGLDCQKIGYVKVMMEGKENEIGIRIITKCSFYDGEDRIIHEDNDIIAQTEYNYSDDNADDQVVDDLTKRYNVSSEVIEIES